MGEVMNDTIKQILIAHSKKLSRDLEDMEHKLASALNEVRVYEDNVKFLKAKISAIAEQVDVPDGPKPLRHFMEIAAAETDAYLKREIAEDKERLKLKEWATKDLTPAEKVKMWNVNRGTWPS
jgi:hypothetical protein